MPTPPRRRRAELRIPGDREERHAVAVAWYADGLLMHDIIEVCGVSTTTVLRQATRAGVPLRDKRNRQWRHARPLVALIGDARTTELDEAAWAIEHGLSARTVAAIWLLARRRKDDGTSLKQTPQTAPTMRRRCAACGAITTTIEECAACHAPR